MGLRGCSACPIAKRKAPPYAAWLLSQQPRSVQPDQSPRLPEFHIDPQKPKALLVWGLLSLAGPVPSFFTAKGDGGNQSRLIPSGDRTSNTEIGGRSQTGGRGDFTMDRQCRACQLMPQASAATLESHTAEIGKRYQEEQLAPSFRGMRRRRAGTAC
jgi:hypothetical protein